MMGKTCRHKVAQGMQLSRLRLALLRSTLIHKAIRVRRLLVQTEIREKRRENIYNQRENRYSRPFPISFS